MTSQFSVLLKKYSLPIILLVAGILMLALGMRDNQDSTFMIAAIMMLAAGGISILYSSGKFKPGFIMVIGLAAGVGAAFAIVISWKSVSDTSEYNANYKHCKMLATQNLEDIRYIQKAYMEQNGTYLSSWDDLIDYVKTGTVPFVEAQGVVPSRKITLEERDYLYDDNPPIDNNMTEEEAYRLSLWTDGPNWAADFANFKRDTIAKPIIDFKFGSKSYKINREKQGFYAFSPDSLPIIPFTNKQWNLETLDSLKIGDAVAPAIYVHGMIPFADIQGKNDDTEELFFGSITTHNTDGSWENE